MSDLNDPDDCGLVSFFKVEDDPYNLACSHKEKKHEKLKEGIIVGESSQIESKIACDVIAADEQQPINYQIKREKKSDEYDLEMSSKQDDDDKGEMKSSDVEMCKKFRISVRSEISLKGNKSFTVIKSDKASVFNCFCCRQYFNNENDWQLHMRDYYNFVGCFPKQEDINFDDIGEKVYSNNEKLFKCKNCNYASPVKRYVNRHFEARHKERRLPCAFCPNKLFSCVYYLKNHVTDLHAPFPVLLFCNDCNYSTSIKRNLSVHVIDVHYPNRKCKLCSFVANRKRLKHHMLTHRKKRNLLKCNLCDYTTYLNSSLLSHQTCHSEIGILKCDKCPYITMNKSAIDKHLLKKHSFLYKFNCKTCGKSFKRFSELNKHMKWEHSDGIEFICSHCSYWTNRKDLYFIHLNLSHKNQFEFQCCQCKKVCESSEEFRNHVYTAHDPCGVTYYCAVCPYKSVQKGHLRNHIDSKHNIWRLYKCRECKYRTICKRYLYKHVQNRHNPNKVMYNCVYCCYKSAVENNLKTHLLKCKNNHNK